MQYGKCYKCAHDGICRILMAEAISSLGQFVRLFNQAQTRKTDNKCILQIDYSCENFIEKNSIEDILK
jgi:hypothetical protein